MSDSIKEIICSVAYIIEPPEQVNDDASLAEDLGINSFEMYRLSFELEKRFGVDISGDALKGFVKVSDVIDYMTLRASGGVTESSAI